MATVPVPPPPPPIAAAVEIGSTDQTPQPNSNVESTNSSSIATDIPLRPNDLRNFSKNWSLAGDAGVFPGTMGRPEFAISGSCIGIVCELLLYLHDFSQRIISKTTEIEKLVEGIGNSTKGSYAKVNNTFNDFLMVSSNQFIENRVYDEEVAEEKSDKENKEKQDKSREELESEILGRFSESVKQGLEVLDDAFITVEIKAELDDSEDDEDGDELPQTPAADPIIEAKDLYSSRPLPYLIGSVEFLHDESLGLIEVPSDDESSNKADGKEMESSSESETETESESEESTDESSEEEMEVDKPAAKKKSLIADSSEESESDLFGEPKAKKKHVVDSESEESEEMSDVEKEKVEEKPKPKMDLQAELASKLGLGIPKQVDNTDAKSTISDWDTESLQQDNISISSKHRSADTQSIASKRSRKSTRSKNSRRDESTISETASISSSRDRTKSIDNKKSVKKQKKETKMNDEENDLFGPPKNDDFFNEIDDGAPFGKSGGLFSSKKKGNSLFDEPEEEDLFSETPKHEPIEESVQEKDDAVPQKPNPRTTSTGKKLPAGAVSIFGDSGEGLFASPKKEQPLPRKVSTVSTKQKPVQGLFDEDEDDIFANKAETEQVKSQRKRTLELFDDQADEEKGDDFLNVNKQTKKAPVGGVSMFGSIPPKSELKKESQKDKKNLFSDEDDELFNDTSASKSTANVSSKEDGTVKVADKHKQDVTSVTAKKKTNVISLFDDDEEDGGQDDDDIFAGLSSAKITKPSLKKETSKISKPKGLFDEDEDDLFATPISKPSASDSTPKQTKSKENALGETTKIHSPATTKKNKPIKPPSKNSLFESDDDLFGEKPKRKEASKRENQTNVDAPKEDNATPKQSAPASEEEKTLPKPSQSKTNLFGSDDDLFNEKPKAKSNSLLKNESTQSPIDLPKDIAQAKASKPAIPSESKQDKPLSAKPLSKNTLFDSDEDLFAEKPKAKLPQEKTEIKSSRDSAKTVLKKSTNKPLPTTAQNENSLFDNDEDDLFSDKPKSKTREKADEPQPKRETPEKPKATSNLPVLDDSDDDLFSSIKKANDKPSKESGKKKKPLFTGKPSKKSIFDDDGDGEDDLFSALSKSTKTINDKVENVNINTSGFDQQKAVTEEDSISVNVEDQDLEKSEAIFASEEIKPVVESKPKKPVGGVSLFGGFDPLAARDKLKASKSDRDISPEKSSPIDRSEGLTRNPKESAVLPVKTEAELMPDKPQGKQEESSEFSGKTDTVPTETGDNDSVDGSSSRPSQTKNIGKIKATINFNPNALLPGAAPPMKKEDPVVASFDKPAETKVLEHTNKTRVRGHVKRRPPTRKPRESATDIVDGKKDSENFDTGEIVDSNRQAKDVVGENIEPEKVVRKPIKVSDIFDDSDDDIFSSKPVKKTQKDSPKSHQEKTDSLIQPKSKKDEEDKSQKTISDSHDIFGLAIQNDTDPLNEFNASLSQTHPPKSKTSTEEKTTSKDITKSFDASKKTDIFNGDSDDIFSTSKTFSNTSKKKSDTPTEDINKKKKENENAGIEDDLFGSSSVKPTKAKETKKVETEVLEEDDLFSGTTKPKKASSKGKMKARQLTDDDLFGDSGSIFDDLPSSSSKKEKKKKKEKKFDDTEDIFATSSEDIFSHPKKTKPVKKTTTQVKKTSVLSIFDENAPSIFDDPLNALGGD